MNKIVLSKDDNHKILQDETTGKLYYEYNCGTDVTFSFSLFSEIGKPYKNWFKAQLKELNITPILVETETDYYEANLK